MGITIHYQLHLRDESALHSLITTVREYAIAHGWPIRDIARADSVLPRSNDVGDWDYSGPSSGIEVLPEALAQSMATCGDMIRDAMATHPNAKGPVRLATGRWADVIT